MLRINRYTRVQRIAFVVLAALSAAFAIDNNLCRTPPMGWNSWNYFRSNINDSLIRQIADAMVASGMRDAGYRFVNLDDCWQAPRDSRGNLQANPAKFPKGLKDLADYIHSKGLKFGIYSGPGPTTCAGFVGSAGYFAQDVASFAAWGVDYLKLDKCSYSGDVAAVYRDFGVVLKACPQPIVYSVAATGGSGSIDWGQDFGNLWRTTDDIIGVWEYNVPNRPSWANSVVYILDMQEGLAANAGPGGWNDPDMLQIGNKGMNNSGIIYNMTYDEERSHFSMWCMLAAPLLTSNDLRAMSDTIKTILTNSEAIAVDQDSAGICGVKIRTTGNTEVWCKPLGFDGTAKAVALLNRTTVTANIAVRWTEIGLDSGNALVRDLWAHRDIGTSHDSIVMSVKAHATALLKITGTPYPPPPTGTTFLSNWSWSYAANRWGPVERDMSVGEKLSSDGKTLTLAGVTYSKGLGTHAQSMVRYNLGRVCSRFQAAVGIDDEVGNNGSVIFQVWADNKKLYDSDTMTGASGTKRLDVDVSGKRELVLLAKCNGDIGSDHADWADAKIIRTTTSARQSLYGIKGPVLSAQVRPSIFSGSPVRIHFTLPTGATTGMVRLTILDLQGTCVATLMQGPCASGPHTVVFCGQDSRKRNLPPGRYICRLEWMGHAASAPLLVMR